MSKDPVQMFVDEITLIRQEIQKLKRTSLSREEAEDLNQVITKGQADIIEVGKVVEHSIGIKLDQAVSKVRVSAAGAASHAAETALHEHRGKIEEQATLYAKAAGEARQQAWRYFSGFWGWLTAATALGSLLGALVMFLMIGHSDATAFGKTADIYCTAAGGERITTDDGFRYCGVWIDNPADAAK